MRTGFLFASLASQSGSRVSNKRSFRRLFRTFQEPHRTETTESVIDVADQFKRRKAEQRDSDVLIPRKLGAPIQRLDGRMCVRSAAGGRMNVGWVRADHFHPAGSVTEPTSTVELESPIPQRRPTGLAASNQRMPH
jgi:hypothetical protein